jgi:F5/8 type C domain
MKRYNKHLILGLCAASLALGLASCKKDGDSVDTLLERNYPPRVYIQADRYSALENNYSLQHGSTAVTGDNVGYFTVRLNRPSSKDVVVTLKSTVDNSEVASAVTLSATEVTVKAGQVASDPVSVTLDLSALTSRAAAESYTVQVSIESIKSAASGVDISSNLNLYSAIFSKSAKSEEAVVVGDSGVDFSSINYFDQNDRATKWTVSQVTEGIDGANDPKRVIDGNFGTDFASNNRGFSFVVDFGKVISGFRGVLTYYWADWTAPKEIQLECSVDGTTWTNLGRADISALTGDAKSFFGLKKAYPARYVRYTVTKPVSRTSITEFYAFEDAAEATADDIFSGATE